MRSAILWLKFKAIFDEYETIHQPRGAHATPNRITHPVIRNRALIFW